MSLKNELLTDGELIAASCEGNEEAFRMLFDKYWNDLYKIAAKRISSAEDIKDLLQDVFLSLWNNIREVKVADSLGGYLYVSLRNKILNYYQKKDTRLKALAIHPFKAAQSENQAWINLQTRELQLFISQQVARMPPQMKQIYLLSREEQLTNAEIAELLALAPQTVKNQLYRALERIRVELKSRNAELVIMYILAARYFR
ncbi:MAG: RNA polymerase sigma-70 factor [Flavitalea sp.]